MSDDPIIRFVEDCEARAISQIGLNADDLHARADLRTGLLDAITNASRTRRLAALLDRLHQEVTA